MTAYEKHLFRAMEFQELSLEAADNAIKHPTDQAYLMQRATLRTIQAQTEALIAALVRNP